MILASDKQSVTVFDSRKIEQVAGGEVVRIKTTGAPSHPGWRDEVKVIEFTLQTGYTITMPIALIEECKKLLEVTA